MNSIRPGSFPVVLGRLTWVVIGPLALPLTAFAIAIQGGGWFTVLDLFYLFVLASMIVGRWVEFQSGSPQTATGEPAKPQDLPRDILFAVLIGGAIWALANVIGNRG